MAHCHCQSFTQYLLEKQILFRYNYVNQPNMAFQDDLLIVAISKGLIKVRDGLEQKTR